MTAWLTLSPLPKACRSYPLLHQQRGKNILYCVQAEINPIYPAVVHKYDFDDDSWLQLKMLSPVSVSSLTSCDINDNGDKIYVMDMKRGLMTIFNLYDTNDCKTEQRTIVDAITCVNTNNTAMIHNEEMHTVGGFDIFKHIKCDLKNYKCSELHDLSGAAANDLQELHSYGSIKTVGKWILFGGISGSSQIDTILVYDINTKSWNTSSTKLPKAISSQGCATISNGSIVLLFGGTEGNGEYENDIDDIYMYRVKNGDITKLRAKCPMKGYNFRAITWTHPRNDGLLVNGWMRCKWKQCEINHQLFPPQYLLKMIERYALTEIIDLFCARPLMHYRIEAIQLFK